MAATWMKPVRAKNGKSAGQTFSDTLHYITNPIVGKYWQL